MDDCIFCDILAGQAEASFVAGDERVVAFADILPIGEGHTLVIPRRHAIGLHDLDPEDGAAMFRLGQRIAAAQRRLGLAEGVNLFLADGVVAGQEVFHAHLHVLPRQDGDALTLSVDYAPAPSRDALDTTAARLRDALEHTGG
ncbi:MAG: HIT domain-containing protein [Nitriliruptoraceae bacterium]|nr:HIT domain-containing protein [Nitriliruptoraceae bacterium]